MGKNSGVDTNPSGTNPAEAVTCGPIVAGGDCLVRRKGAKTMFVSGGMPGEVVTVDVVEERKDLLRAVVREVVSPSPDRVEPPCSRFLDGCGGCQWQFMSVNAQADAKVSIVRDALQRIAKSTVEPLFGGSVDAFGYRTTMHCVVNDDGRAALHKRFSAENVTIADCPIAHPSMHDVLTNPRWPDADHVTLRVGVSSGERVAWARKKDEREGARGSQHIGVPRDVTVTRNGRKAPIDERVAEHDYVVSMHSFFQSGPQAAELLISTILSLVDASDVAERHTIRVILDAYAGVGVLAGALGRKLDAQVVTIESSGAAVNDAKVNLADLDARIVLGEVAAVRPGDIPQPDLIVADPARSGLGPSASKALCGLGAPMLVLASCDPASFARDVVLLANNGYALSSATVLDLFPQTHHCETVGMFKRETTPDS